ncbi:MAG: glycosyltransferase [Ruminococcus sp.]|nr:glycosyltransferase [Ruminococcus sp.]
MNIAFDAYAILGPMSRNRGIGNYALSQFSGMVSRDPDNHYFFFNAVDKEFRLSEHTTGGNLTEDYIGTGSDCALLRSEAYSSALGAAIKRYIAENSIDIFYITSPFESSFIRYQKEWFADCRVVVTVYDIIPYVMKDKYLADKTTYDWYIRCIEGLRWADELFVISESVKTDLVKLLGFDPEKIKVIWGAVDDKYGIISIDSVEKAALLGKFGVTKPFIMCTGGEDGRKNLDGLVRAYSLMPTDLRKKYQLVVVCKLSENGRKKLTDEAKKCGVENDVVFTGFVTDDELLRFYNLASLMAFPSKYEGFGLPIVEAWACGTPVLTADNSSLREIGGDAAVLVDADSDRSIADGMAKMLSDEEMLRDYTRRGAERLELYRWDSINDGIIALLNAIEPPVRSNTAPERVKIAFFTPLPPIESGISDYSEDIISELCNYCDIDVYIDGGYAPSPRFPDNVRIFSHREYPSKASGYYDTVFQMGNSEFHYYMYDYIRKYHGTVVLHDYNLHGAFYHRAVTLEKGNYKLYREFVEADFSDKADYLSAISSGAANPDIYGMELNSYITGAADRIIVHSQEARRKLLMRDISRNTQVIASYAVILPPADSSAVKEKNGISPDTVVISAFGGIHRTKRAMPILQAFARLRHEHENVMLLFAGKPADDLKPELERFIADNDLADSVRITGYISIEQFKEYIDMTDICLNLRYPSNGETSGSLMRILAKGRCVVINDIGSFSEIDDDICVKLPSVETMGEVHEPDEIYSALSRLVSSPELREEKGSAARKFAEENLDLHIVARKYYEYILSGRREPALSEQMIAALRNDPNVSPSDYPEIAETLAYAKGHRC